MDPQLGVKEDFSVEIRILIVEQTRFWFVIHQMLNIEPLKLITQTEFINLLQFHLFFYFINPKKDKKMKELPEIPPLETKTLCTSHRLPSSRIFSTFLG